MSFKFNPLAGHLDLVNPTATATGGGGSYSAGISTLGNTSGTTGMASNRLVLVGGNNITLSQSINGGSATITVSAFNQSVQTQNMVSLLGSTGDISFANSNGITFGGNNSTITASHNGLTSQLNQAFSAGAASSTFQTLSFQDSNGVSFSNNAGAIRLTHDLQYTSNTSNITVNAVNVTDARVRAVIANGATLSTGSIGFRDLNGISFLTTTGNSIQLTHDLQYTSNTSNITSNALHTSSPRINLSAGTTSNNLSALTLSNSNGLSFGLNGSVVTASHNGLTSQSNQALSAANGSFTFQTATFANSNGISFSTGTQGLYASHNGLTTARASNDAIGLNTAQSNVTWTVNSSGLSLDARGYAGTGTSVTGGASVTLNSNGLQFNGTALAGTGTTFNGTNLSASMTLNTAGLRLDMSAGAGGANPAASASNGSFTFQTLGFSNANNVTFGTSAGSIITASVAAPGAAAENNWVNLLGANTAGNTTASGSTIGLSGINLTLSGTNGSAINISAPATSSLSAINGFVISTNGSTISMGESPNPIFEPRQLMTGSISSSHGTNWLFNPLQVTDVVAFSKINIIKSFNIAMPALTSANSTWHHVWGMTHDVKLWTRQDYAGNSKNMNSVGSGRFAMTWDVSYNNSSHSAVASYITNSTGGTTSWSTSSQGVNYSSYWTGYKFLQIPMVSTLAQGEYWIAHRISTSGANSNSNMTMMSISNLGVSNQLTTVGGIGSNGSYTSIMPFAGNVGFGAASGTTDGMGFATVTNTPQHFLYVQFHNLPVTTTP